MNSKEISNAVRDGKKLSDLSIIQLSDFATTLVTEAYAMQGYPTQSTDTAVNARLLASVLKTKFFNLTDKEVIIAMRCGSLKEFGEVYRLGTATFSGWIDFYSRSDERKTALRSLGIKENAKTRLSQKRIDELNEGANRRITASLFAFFRKNGKLPRSSACSLLRYASLIDYKFAYDYLTAREEIICEPSLKTKAEPLADKFCKQIFRDKEMPTMKEYAVKGILLGWSFRKFIQDGRTFDFEGESNAFEDDDTEDIPDF
ncbi:MAG: hypothetical protein WCS17_01805 [Prevotella sp.]